MSYVLFKEQFINDLFINKQRKIYISRDVSFSFFHILLK